MISGTVSILVSIWMHLEERCCIVRALNLNVSILVSIWMHLEVDFRVMLKPNLYRFNPSFYMDASGRESETLPQIQTLCFNPSFYMDASGSYDGRNTTYTYTMFQS